jgi:hypothetical protein
MGAAYPRPTVSRFLLWTQILIVVFVAAGVVIAVTKLV